MTHLAAYWLMQFRRKRVRLRLLVSFIGCSLMLAAPRWACAQTSLSLDDFTVVGLARFARFHRQTASREHLPSVVLPRRYRLFQPYRRSPGR
jgi:hypothetical protein